MFTLRFPFSIAPNIVISGIETNIKIENLTFTLREDGPFHILTISGFPTETAAKKYVERLQNGLIWLLLEGGIPSKAEFEADSIDENGNINGNKAAIYSSATATKIWTGYPSTIVVTDTTVDNMLQLINEGVSLPINEKLIKNPKLGTALDLYGAYFTEHSFNAKFLTLMLALETLKPKDSPTQMVLELIDKFIKEAEKLQDGIKQNPKTEYISSNEDVESLKTLITNLENVCKKSISDAIRHLVLTTLQNNGDSDAEDMANTAKKLYGLRCDLVHKGKLELSKLPKATEDAKNIVERVLKAKFIELEA